MISFGGILGGVISWLFQKFKKIFLPDRTDLIGSLFLSIPLYLIFGLSMILLLPLIIVCVFIVYFIRRAWRFILIFWTVKIMHKKTEKEIKKIKKILK